MAGNRFVEKPCSSTVEGSSMKSRPKKRWIGVLRELNSFMDISGEDAREMIRIGCNGSILCMEVAVMEMIKLV